VPGLTAGSASNSQEISIYAAMAKGIYLYDLTGIIDSRTFRGLPRSGDRPGQGTVGATAPIRLIYV